MISSPLYLMEPPSKNPGGSYNSKNFSLSYIEADIPYCLNNTAVGAVGEFQIFNFQNIICHVVSSLFRTAQSWVKGIPQSIAQLI